MGKNPIVRNKKTGKREHKKTSELRFRNAVSSEVTKRLRKSPKKIPSGKSSKGSGPVARVVRHTKAIENLLKKQKKLKAPQRKYKTEGYATPRPQVKKRNTRNLRMK